jgi:hypothetical protein
MPLPEKPGGAFCFVLPHASACSSRGRPGAEEKGIGKPSITATDAENCAAHDEKSRHDEPPRGGMQQESAFVIVELHQSLPDREPSRLAAATNAKELIFRALARILARSYKPGGLAVRPMSNDCKNGLQ